MSLIKSFILSLVVVAWATMVTGQRGEVRAVVPYRQLALEAFREVDPEAAHVFVSSRDASGFPAALESEDGRRLESSRLWPTIVKLIAKKVCSSSSPMPADFPSLPAPATPSQPAPPQPSANHVPERTYSETTLVLSIIGGLIAGWVLGFGSARLRELWIVLGATATGGICGTCVAVVGFLLGRRRQAQEEEMEAQAEEARHQAYLRKEEEAARRREEVPLVHL